MSGTVAADAEERVEDAAEDWCTVTQAARRLGVSERAIRKKVERGNLEARRAGVGNRVRLLVRLPAEDVAEDRVEDHTEELVRALREHVEDLRAELARGRNHVEDLRTRAEDLRAERDAARVEAAELRGRLAEATRAGPIGRLIEALAARLAGKGTGAGSGS